MPHMQKDNLVQIRLYIETHRDRDHLKNCHGSLSKYNAAKTLKELTELKEKRQNSKRKRERVGEEPNKKTKNVNRLFENLYTLWATGQMPWQACFALTGQKQTWLPVLVSLMLSNPRYTLPHPSTFTRSILPKLKNSVDSFMTKRLKKLMKLKDGSSVAFSIDGLDTNDVEKSAVYDFSVKK